jgi:hypothetical protein
MNFLKRRKRQIDEAARLADATMPVVYLVFALPTIAGWGPPPFVWLLLLVLASISDGLQALSRSLRVPPLPPEMALFLGGDVDFSDTRQCAA